MKFYVLWDTLNYANYAGFAVLGTWSEGTSCKICRYPNCNYIEPLLVEWVEGSDVIGDITLSGYEMIVTKRVKDFFMENDYKCKYKKIEYVKPTTPNKQRKRVQFPYNGPKLSWVIPKEIIKLDEEKSDVYLDIDCKECGSKRYKFRLDGLVINREDWNGQKMFTIKQYKHKIYVTEEGLSEIQSQGFKNYSYKEVGEII